MLYNVTTWHTVATRDVHLLRKQLDIVNSFPKEYVFLNYLRCHDDIGWGLDYDTLSLQGFKERSHKQYLNRYFQGYEGDSNSRGVLYNDDPVTGDARFCGTCASMCGIEKAGFEQDEGSVEGRMFHRLDRLEKIRKSEKVFDCRADVWTIDTSDSSVLCIGRYYEGQKMIGIFNFSEYDKLVQIQEEDGGYTDLISGQEMKLPELLLPAYGYYYLF